MIIQCEQCQTKFRLDDSKVKDSGVKVRCARCKNVFSVSQEQQDNAQVTGFGALLDQNTSLMDEAQPFDPLTPHDETASEESRQEYDFGGSTFDVQEPENNLTSIDPHLFDLPEEEPLTVAEREDKSGDYNPEDAREPEPAVDELPDMGSEITFDGFDFGDVPEYTENNAQNPTPFSDPEGTSFDSAAPLDFNVQFSDFSDSAAVPEAVGGSSAPSATTVDEPFRLGEIDFGDDLSSLSSQQVNPDDSKGGLDFDFGHLDEPQEATSTFASSLGTPWIAPVQAAPQEPRESTELTSDKIGMWGPWFLSAPEQPGRTGQEEEEELSPLSSDTPRKQSHLITYLLSTIAVIGMAMGIYSGTTRTQEVIATPGQSSQSGQTSQPGQSGPASLPAAKISLSGVDAAFVNNKKIGELLVITGSAVNNFETPRAAIQIKGIVYGDNNQVVASKIAYCGNTLSKEQLTSMPLETIEAAMANQLGSALDNLEVAPGKSIPCMVVISKLPEDSKDYGAVPAGSQPATPKQKKTE